MEFSKMAEVLSVVSSIMTIIGIGGFLSWSAFKDGSDRLSTAVLSIFVYSLKTVLCLLAVIFTGLLGVFFHNLMLSLFLTPLSEATGFGYFISVISGGAIRSPTFWISIIMAVGLFLPICLLICFSIYTWSLEPFQRFLSIFRRKARAE